MPVNKIDVNRNFTYPFTKTELTLNVLEKEVGNETLKKLVHN